MPRYILHSLLPKIFVVLLSLGFVMSDFSLAVPDATAAPGSLLGESRKGKKRTHKGAESQRKSRKDRKKTRSRTSTTRSQSRRATSSQRTRRSRTVRRSDRVVTRQRTSVRRHNHYSRHRHRQAVRRNRRPVHRHRSQRCSAWSCTGGRAQRSEGAQIGNRDPIVEPYAIGEVGVSALAIPLIADEALPGIDYRLGLGLKAQWVAFELGFGLAGFRFDPAQETSDITLFSLTGDLKLQPTLSIFEPYASVGLGGHHLNDHVVATSSQGMSLRFGTGLDLRFDSIAVGVHYSYDLFAFSDPGLYGEMIGAEAETLGIGLKLYF